MREKLIELLSSIQDEGRAYGADVTAILSNSQIADYLIANGVTVQKRGRWQEVRIVRYNGVKPYTQFEHRCSNCKWLNKHKKGWNTKFCPNCGADMRGGT